MPVVTVTRPTSNPPMDTCAIRDFRLEHPDERLGRNIGPGHHVVKTGDEGMRRSISLTPERFAFAINVANATNFC